MIAQQIKLEPYIYIYIYIYIYESSLNEMKAITDKSKLNTRVFKMIKLKWQMGAVKLKA